MIIETLSLPILYLQKEFIIKNLKEWYSSFMLSSFGSSCSRWPSSPSSTFHPQPDGEPAWSDSLTPTNTFEWSWDIICGYASSRHSSSMTVMELKKASSMKSSTLKTPQKAILLSVNLSLFRTKKRLPLLYYLESPKELIHNLDANLCLLHSQPLPRNFTSYVHEKSQIS